MNVYRVFPEPRQMLTLGDPDFSDTLSDWYEPPSATSCRLSLISTPGGEIVGPDGTSRSLSNPIDRSVLVAQRQHATAVITGATTVRTEPVPVPGHAPLVILSRTGDLSSHQVTPSSLRADSVIIITGPEVTTDPSTLFPPGVARHEMLGNTSGPSAGEVVEHLHSLGLTSLLVEGGRSVTELFATAQLFDELCVSVTGAPRSENHPPIPWWNPQWGGWTAQHVLTDDQRTLYFRYVRESAE